MMRVKEEIVVDLLRRAPAPSHTEPMSIGVPFRRGLVRATGQIAITGRRGEILASQIATLTRWPDGSVRWAQVDIPIATEGRDREQVLILVNEEGASDPSRFSPMVQRDDSGTYRIDTGVARAAVGGSVFAPFAALHSAAIGSPAATSTV